MESAMGESFQDPTDCKNPRAQKFPLVDFYIEATTRV